LALGFFNGLLPCGLVYLAVAGAVASGDTISGAVYMLAFGFGTLPLMFIFSAFGNWLGFKQRLFIRKYLPVFSVTIAILLILRGLNLGIPYVSPAFTRDVHEPIPADQHCSPTPPQEAHFLLAE
jgi:sulfite exporter TauE/SafE